jgi:hypothetical protein
MVSPQVTGRKVTVRYICERFGIVDRTVGRWIETGVLPQPYINKRRYFDLQEVDERMANRAGRPSLDARREAPSARDMVDNWKPVGTAASKIVEGLR